MDSRDREQRYDDYIERPSQAAAAIGRRPPYHLEYLRRHGGMEVPAGSTAKQGKEEGMRSDKRAFARGGALCRVLCEPRGDELPLRCGFEETDNCMAAGTGVYS